MATYLAYIYNVEMQYIYVHTLMHTPAYMHSQMHAYMYSYNIYKFLFLIHYQLYNTNSTFMI